LMSTPGLLAGALAVALTAQTGCCVTLKDAMLAPVEPLADVTITVVRTTVLVDGAGAVAAGAEVDGADELTVALVDGVTAEDA
jgi:hypothetical protein